MDVRIFGFRAMKCMCAQTRPWFIVSSKEFWGNGVRTHVNCKEGNPLYWRFRGGSKPRRCIRQDSEPNTLPTELFRPLSNQQTTTTAALEHLVGHLKDQKRLLANQQVDGSQRKKWIER